MSSPKAEARRRPRPRLYRLHRWIGLVVAVVGTLVFFSGVLATFASEIDAWATRAPQYPAIGELEGFDLDRALAAATPSEFEQARIAQGHGEPLLAYFETPSAVEGEPAHARGFSFDPETLEVLERREGTPGEVRAPRPHDRLAAFVIELHVFLLLPRTLGLLVTGLLAFGLLALLVSGVWVHQPTAEKLRRRPRKTRLRVFAGDLHTLVGSWTLPYTAIIALTGAFFCFSSTVVLPVLTLARYGGDRAEMLADLVPEVPVEPAAGPSVQALDPMLRDALARSEGASFRSLSLEHWGGEQARATVALERESAWGDEHLRYVYDGHDGRFLGEKPEVGAVPSVSSAALELIDALHFGTLLGRLTQVLWVLLGLATCGLSMTGLLVYARRQVKGHAKTLAKVEDAPRSARAAAALAVALSGGLIACCPLVLASWATACAAQLDEPATAMTATLLLGLAAAAALGWTQTLERALALTLGCAGLGFLGAPALVAVANDLPLLELWSRGPQPWPIAGDLLALALALGCLAGARALLLNPRTLP